MTSKQKRHIVRLDYALITIMALMLASVAGLSVMEASNDSQHFAQATPSQTAPETPSIPAGKENGPAQSKPGGTRPTTPAPEPAQPDSDAQKSGAKPTLPAAPAEKMGDPIKH